MDELIKRVRASALIRNFALVTSATAIAQVINLAWTPVLTRLYDPAAFGVLSVYMSSVMMISQCASLCLEQAIVLEKKDSDAFTLLVASCVLVLLFGAGAGLVASLCRLGGLLSILVASGVVASGLSLPLMAWCTRRCAFRATTASQLLRVTMLIAAQAVGYVVGAGAIGLIAGFLSGEVASSTLLALWVLRSERKTARLPEFPIACQVIRRHRNFPLYTAPQTLLNATSQSMPAFLLAACFGAPVAGAYWLAMRMLLVPCTLVGNAFRQVYYEHACRLHRSGASFYPALQSATLALGVTSCIFLLTAEVLAPSAFVLILGGAWTLAGRYVALLAPWAAAMFMDLPAVSVLPILGRQRFAFLFDVTSLGVRALALGGGVLAGSHMMAVGAYSGVGLILNVSLMLFVFTFVRRNDRSSRVALNTVAARYA